MNIKKIASGIVATTAVMAACIAPALATPVTFADFSLRGGAANPFKYTNLGANSTFTLITATIPVTFTYQVSNAYNTAGTAIQATLSFSAQVNGQVNPAGAAFGDDVSERVKNVTFTFHPINSTANLLTLSNTPVPTLLGSTGKIKGTIGDTNINMKGSTVLGDTVYYTSDFLSFSNTTQRGYNFSFSSVDPPTAIAANGYFRGFQTSGTGTFSSDPAPRNPAAPEPASVAAFLIGGMGLALLAFRGRKAARLMA